MRIHRATFLYLTAAIGACRDAPPAAPTALPVVSTAEDSPADHEVDEVDDPSAPSKAAASSCRALEPPGPECEGFYLAPSLCERLERALSPDRGAEVLRCIHEGSGTERMCDFRFLDECAGKALEDGPGDAGAEARCKAAQPACFARDEPTPVFEASRCARALMLVADDRTDALLSCLERHCDVEVCLWGHASIGKDAG